MWRRLVLITVLLGAVTWAQDAVEAPAADAAAPAAVQPGPNTGNFLRPEEVQEYVRMWEDEKQNEDASQADRVAEVGAPSLATERGQEALPTPPVVESSGNGVPDATTETGAASAPVVAAVEALEESRRAREAELAAAEERKAAERQQAAIERAREMQREADERRKERVAEEAERLSKDSSEGAAAPATTGSGSAEEPGQEPEDEPRQLPSNTLAQGKKKKASPFTSGIPAAETVAEKEVKELLRQAALARFGQEPKRGVASASYNFPGMRGREARSRINLPRALELYEEALRLSKAAAAQEASQLVAVPSHAAVVLRDAELVAAEVDGSAEAGVVFAASPNPAFMSLAQGEVYNALGEVALYGEDGNPPNYAQAVRLFNQSASFGYPPGQANLGLLLSLGIGAPKDDAVALLHLYFASLGGSLVANLALGYRHLHGYGVPESCETAALYYQPVAEDVVREIMEEHTSSVIERIRLADDKARLSPLEEDEGVLQYFQHSAENGDVHAQVEMGRLHFFGARGVGQDHQRAARYFQAAAGRGEPTAMSALAQMHMQGLGVPASNETAVDYFQKAADKGHPAAQNGLGVMYLNGQGVKKDEQMALRLFKKAAEQGNPEAQFNLGAMYFAGLGVEKKYSTSLTYFTMAGHQGHLRALYNLAQMYLNGLGTIRDCPTGVKFLKTVSERGSWAGVLGEAHRHFLKGEVEWAAALYATAAEQGYEIAQANSAWLLSQGLGYSESNQHELAIRHYTRASHQGDVEALRTLGDYAWYGWAHTQQQPDYARAAKLYQSAADSRNAQSMFNLGYMHEHGLVSGSPDFHLAKRYYDMALETDPEALVPVRLALVKLWLTQVWRGDESAMDLRQWSFWPSSINKAWDAFFGPAEAAQTPTPKVPAPTQQQQQPAGGNQPQRQQQQQQGKGKSARRDRPGVGGWLLRQLANTHPEDLLLWLLLGLLALVVYMRAAPERQQR